MISKSIDRTIAVSFVALALFVAWLISSTDPARAAAGGTISGTPIARGGSNQTLISVTNISVFNTTISSNISVTNLFFFQSFGSNFYVTNVVVFNTFTVEAGGRLIVSNAFITNLYVSNIIAQTIVVSNGNVYPIGAGTNIVLETNGGTLIINAAGGGGSLGPLKTNMYTTNVAGTPLVGSIWHNGTNFGHPETNGSRVGFEYIPTRASFRQGIVAGTGAEYWNATNLGIVSTAFGSNNLAGGFYSAVLGGSRNLINTNNEHAVIVGGENNSIAAGGKNFIGGGDGHTIGTLSSNHFIGGGDANVIDANITVGSTIAGGTGGRIRAQGGFIGGGSGNDVRAHSGTIAGGINNVAGDDIGNADIGTTIGGGSANLTFGAYSTIAGGNANLVNADTGTNATIGGGVGNTTSSINTVIGGGALNVIENLAEQATIGGGFTNYISTASSAVFATIPGGVSNRVNSAPMAWTLGSFGTNATPKSLLISPSGTHGSNRLHVTATATTNIGPLKVQAGNAFVAGNFASVGGTLSVSTTPIVNAGTAETNMITGTIPAHVLTNAGDRITFRASGRFAATADDKAIAVVYGSETIYASGTLAQNGGDFVLTGEIIRTGDTGQSVNVGFTGNGAFDGGSTFETVQTNGIATTLKITATAAASGVITNRSLVIEWNPTP